MAKQHPNVKRLRALRKIWCIPEADQDALDWAIRVCEAADNLVNVKGRHHSEVAYKRLDEAVNEE